MGWQTLERFGDQRLGWLGAPIDGVTSPDSLQTSLENKLGREAIVVIPDLARPIKRIAWCTGGAQSWFEAAIAAGADAFVTGEISEPQAHLAQETGVAFFACGHHATERYGAPAFASHVASELGLAHQFIDISNPA
jgi:putative NIF3 family GTP cyclohydrolase 1 type 2